MTKQPSTDEEWIIHSLNIHGSFFQRKCVELINTLPVKSLQQHINVIDTEYPVEFPPQNTINTKNKESRVDILARITTPSHLKFCINLVIECKKNNPDYTNWVFFEKYPEYVPKQDFMGTFASENGDARYTYQTYQLSGSTCSEGREVKENYSKLNERDKTKTTNTNIEDACYQVVLATHSLLDERFMPFTLPIEKRINQRFILYLFVPMIVTTANLYLCNYPVTDVSIDRGEIPLEKTKLEKVNSLWYEYPIPPHLRLSEKEWIVNNQYGGRDVYHRRYIYIVNSLEFQNALIHLIKSAEYLLDFN